ncbi:MAG: hypothetical protein DRH26_01815 [Deltaproteobacteria bacterium]|nr:MAG: hypothetical protein DRH26_01815 [Deltaproteobacteria bacterium]
MDDLIYCNECELVLDDCETGMCYVSPVEDKITCTYCGSDVEPISLERLIEKHNEFSNDEKERKKKWHRITRLIRENPVF